MKKKKEFRKAALFFAAILIVGIFFTPVAFGEEVEVPEVKVTYTREGEDPKKIPANVTVIDKEEIEKSGARNVPELLRRKAGVNVQSFYGNGTADSVDMRGFSRGINTLVMINGVRLNNPDLSNVSWNLIPMEAIERIEITSGPGSALWGNSATGGVINVITKKGYDKPILETGFVWGSDSRIDVTASAGMSNDTWRFLVGAGYHYTEGYRQNNKLDLQNYTVSAGYTPNDILSISADFGYSKDSYGLAGTLERWERDAYGRKFAARDNKFDGGHSERLYLITGLGLDFDTFGKLKFDYSYRQNLGYIEDYSYARGFFPPTVGTDPMENYSLAKSELREHGLSAKYTLNLDFENISNRLTFGLDNRWVSYESEGLMFSRSLGFFGSDETTVMDTDSNSRSTGIFVYNELTLFENWILTAGYRYEYMKLSFNTFSDNTLNRYYGIPEARTQRDTLMYNEKAITAGLTFLYGDDSKIFFRYAQGFRMPLIDEITDFWGINKTLKPEKIVSYELGAKHYFTPDISTSLTLYWSNVTDEVYVDPTAFGQGRVSNVNFDKTVHRGVEVGIDARLLDWLEVYLTYAFQEAYFDYYPYKGKALPLVPKNLVTFGFDIDYEGFSFSADGKWVDDRERDGDYYETLKTVPNYFVVDMRIGYTYEFGDGHTIEAFAGINNVFDEYYSDYGRGGTFGADYTDSPLPGRAFYGGMNFSF